MTRPRVALVTGGARRIGAAIARHLHGRGYNLAIHHNRSAAEARELARVLNDARAESAVTLCADLRDPAALAALAEAGARRWRGVDLLVNNASCFYPTPLGDATAEQFDELMTVNLRAPFLLSQALAVRLGERRGCIVNVADVYAERPLRGHGVYCASKAGLVSLTRSLAVDLAPRVRVNAVSPGAVLWPEGEHRERPELLAKIPAGALGDPKDVARAVAYLALEADYVTGQVIHVDGGRSVSL